MPQAHYSSVMTSTDGKILPQSGIVGDNIHRTTWWSGGRIMMVVTVRNSVMITIARIRLQIGKT